MSGPASTALCLGCGMCCDGTLFGHVNLDPGEQSPGLEVVEINGRRAFRQPCAQLAGKACAIYERRPASCRRFRCETLIALEAGTIDAEAAARQVDQALAAKAALATLPPHAERERLMATLKLRLILDRHFRRPDKRQLG